MHVVECREQTPEPGFPLVAGPDRDRGPGWIDVDDAEVVVADLGEPVEVVVADALEEIDREIEEREVTVSGVGTVER